MIQALSVGEMWEGGTCLERARVLEKRGWRVYKFDITPYKSAGARLRRALQHRFLHGPDVARFNRDLLSYVSKRKSFDVIWIDKGRWVYADTLRTLKGISGAILVHYTPDPAFTVHTSRHFLRGLGHYDLCITTKKYELSDYRKAGAKEVMFSWQGIDERFSSCKPCADPGSIDRSGLVFIGHCEPHYVDSLTTLANAGLPLKIWGSGWQKAANRNTSIASSVCGEGVYGDEYPQTLAKGAIGIGLLSKMCPDAFTTRSLEIPAAGCMLLAECTDDHLELFADGREAIFYTGKQDLIEKARYYLENRERRIEIALAGRAKVLGKYFWSDVLAEAIGRVEELCG